MKKEIKECFNYYLDNINSDDFNEYLKREKAEGEKVHQEFIRSEKPSWSSRTDYFEDSTISHMIIGDVLSNDGVVRLLKKLYSLPKKKYKVKNYYKKPPIRNKYDYIKLQYTHSHIGLLAEIDFLKDKYIKSIEINWSQINNYFAYVEYSFHFVKCFDDTLYNDFINENLKKLTSKDYMVWYRFSDDKDDNYFTLRQMNSELFNIICQHYITSLFYSEYGKYKPLINIAFAVREQPIDISTLYICDFGRAFYNRKRNFIIVGDWGKDNFLLCSGNNIIPNFSLCGPIHRYGNDFYYNFFGERELKFFEYEFSRYSNGRKKLKYNKKIIRLLNQMQSVSDYEYNKDSKLYSKFNESWDFYIGNDRADIKDWQKKGADDYRDIYQKNFSYFKMLTEINYTKSNHIISIIATFISIVATVISLIAIFV